MVTRIRHLVPRLLLAFLVAFLTGEIAVRAAVALNPRIKYIVANQELGEFSTLEELLETQPFLISHTGRFGYWTNSFGFNDREFEVPKPSGRRRILALGDSFCYGAVPYPYVVLTKVEEQLGHDTEIELDLLNCGLPGQDLSGYRALLQTTVDRFAPDLVVLHIYMGNDPPDFRLSSEPAVQFYLIRFLTRIGRLLEEKPPAHHPEASPTPGQRVAGGTKVHPGERELTDDDLAQPRFDVQELERQLKGELGRFLRIEPTDAAWAPLRDEFDTIHQILKSREIPLVVVLYPSRMQVYPERATALAEKNGLSSEAVDLHSPNAFFATYCREKEIPLLDLTETMQEAAESGQPLYVANDTHWNIRANAVAAEAEARFLNPYISEER
jgi:hypothetical protein